jgi:hypothetical protein
MFVFTLEMFVLLTLASHFVCSIVIFVFTLEHVCIYNRNVCLVDSSILVFTLVFFALTLVILC